MKTKQKLLVSSAISGLILGVALANAGDTKKAVSSVAADTVGECHGVNSCKGTGECGGKGHSCAGKNSCKGKGYLKLSKKDCTEKKGTFKTVMTDTNKE